MLEHQYKSAFALRGTPMRMHNNVNKIDTGRVDEDGTTIYHLETRGERKRLKRRESNMRTLGINSMPGELIHDKYLHSFARKYGPMTSDMQHH